MLRPLGDKLVVKKLDMEYETKTASGLVLAQDPNSGGLKRAEVVAVGPGKVAEGGTRVPVDVLVGDVVVYHSNYGTDINFDPGKSVSELMLLHEEDILAVEVNNG